jgi:thiosulfate dehydrogenase
MNLPPVTRLIGRLRRTTCLLACYWLSACGGSTEQSAVEKGRQLFESRSLSQSHLNDYTCATCHELQASTPASKKAGAALAGVTSRATFWGEQEPDLLAAINACRNYFMGDNQPLSAKDERARALYAYLESLEPGDANPTLFTIVTSIEPLPRGEEGHGRVLFANACASCHGSMHIGLNRLNASVPILPEDTLASHTEYSPRVQRLVFTEKIRHGLFLGYGGVMPPFSAEVLSDQDVSDVLEALGVIGE